MRRYVKDKSRGKVPFTVPVNVLQRLSDEVEKFFDILTIILSNFSLNLPHMSLGRENLRNSSFDYFKKTRSDCKQ